MDGNVHVATMKELLDKFMQGAADLQAQVAGAS